jgi:hypothetical protein
MAAIGIFRDLVTGARRQAMDTAVKKIFTSKDQIPVDQTLARFKSLMLDDFKADKIWINIRQEGADLIITELPGGDFKVTKVPSDAAPHG